MPANAARGTRLRKASKAMALAAVGAWASSRASIKRVSARPARWRPRVCQIRSPSMSGILPRALQLSLDLVERLVDPSLDGPGEGPHPPVVRAGEARDDVPVKRRVACGRDALGLGDRPQRLEVRLPLQPGAPPRQERREREEAVDEDHPHPAEPLELLDVDELVPERLPGVIRVPGVEVVRYVDGMAEGGDVLADVGALPAEGERPERFPGRALVPVAALLHHPHGPRARAHRVDEHGEPLARSGRGAARVIPLCVAPARVIAADDGSTMTTRCEPHRSSGSPRSPRAPRCSSRLATAPPTRRSTVTSRSGPLRATARRSRCRGAGTGGRPPASRPSPRGTRAGSSRCWSCRPASTATWWSRTAWRASTPTSRSPLSAASKRCRSWSPPT